MSGFSLVQYNNKHFGLSQTNRRVFKLTNVPIPLNLKLLINWHEYMDFIWAGTISGDALISELPDKREIAITNKDFYGDYIPATSSSTFKLQADADFILDDAYDLLWFGRIGNQRNVSVSELVNYDAARTIIKYSDNPPHDISAIAILKEGVILSSIERDLLFRDFALSLFWDNSLNVYGHLKYNKFAYTQWRPELITNIDDRQFISDTGFWTKSDASVQIIGGSCNFINSPQWSSLRKVGILELGHTYIYTYSISGLASGSYRCGIGGPVGIERFIDGTYSEIITTTTNDTLNNYQWNAANGNFRLDNVSIREIW